MGGGKSSGTTLRIVSQCCIDVARAPCVPESKAGLAARSRFFRFWVKAADGTCTLGLAADAVVLDSEVEPCGAKAAAAPTDAQWTPSSTCNEMANAVGSEQRRFY